MGVRTLNEKITYRSSGVDIEKGYDAVRRIKKHAQKTMRPEVLGGLGLFGGAFQFPVEKFNEPVLISGTDGVGTKLKLAFMTGRHDTIGIDAVAYCVNDIICQGAKPLFFLDYLAVGHLDVDMVDDIVKGIAMGCKDAGCALIGGETAEMPGFYSAGEYDLAGFAVGVVDKSRMIDGSRVQPGDVIIGIDSTGFQSSGFSLVRKVCFDKANLSVTDVVPELETTVGEALLTPTGIYVNPIMKLTQTCDVHGIANISGGGLPENIPRAMNDRVNAHIDRNAWTVPRIFNWLQQLGSIEDDEMWNTFNMGIGMSVIVRHDDVEKAIRVVRESGWESRVIGEIRPGSGKLIFV